MSLNPRSQLVHVISETYEPCDSKHPALKRPVRVPENPQFARSLGGYVLPRCEAIPVAVYDMPDWRLACQCAALDSVLHIFNPEYEEEDNDIPLLYLWAWHDRANYVMN